MADFVPVMTFDEGIVDKFMDADNSTLYLIIGGAVVLLVVLLFIALRPKRAPKEKERPAGVYDDDARIRRMQYAHTSVNASTPIPYGLDLSQAEWDQYMERARTDGKCPQGMSVPAYAEQLAKEEIDASKKFAQQNSAAHEAPRGHHTPRNVNDITPESTGGTTAADYALPGAAAGTPADEFGDLNVPDSLPQVNGDGTTSVTNAGIDPSAVQPPYAGIDSSAVQPPIADPFAVQTPAAPEVEIDQYSGMPVGFDPNSGAVPAADELPPVPTAPPVPDVPAVNPFIAWADCGNMRAGAVYLNDSRQYDGSYLLSEAAGAGAYIGVPRPDGKLDVLLNPAAFGSEYPFYEDGVTVIDQFFNGAIQDGHAVQRVRAAVCETVPGQEGTYRCIQKGDIQQEQ